MRTLLCSPLMNGGTIGVLMGFWVQDYTIVGISGALVVVAFLVFGDGRPPSSSNSSLVSPPLNLWFYGTALLALLAGLGFGESMAFRTIPLPFLGQGRLAHIHLNLLGFATLSIIGTMHNLFPTVLNAQLYSPRLARLTLSDLTGRHTSPGRGFLLSNLWAQIGAGAVVLAAVVMYAIICCALGWAPAGLEHCVRSFFACHIVPLARRTHRYLSGREFFVGAVRRAVRTAASCGDTHLALIGFILQTIFGALSYLLPIMSGGQPRRQQQKTRTLFAQLTSIVERWRILQVGAFTLGTMGLAVVAALVWNYNLHSTVVQVASLDDSRSIICRHWNIWSEDRPPPDSPSFPLLNRWIPNLFCIAILIVPFAMHSASV